MTLKADSALVSAFCRYSPIWFGQRGDEASNTIWIREDYQEVHIVKEDHLETYPVFKATWNALSKDLNPNLKQYIYNHVYLRYNARRTLFESINYGSLVAKYSIILTEIFMYNLKDWRFASIPLPFNWPETGIYVKGWCD